MSTMRVALVVALAVASAPSLAAEPPASLTQHRCYICHSDYDPEVGAAFADIAASYRGRADAVAKIAHDIRAGMQTGGPWHMPPHPEVTQAEAREMARYIMSLDAKQPARRVSTPAKAP
jgi:cytochrome c551/c552